MVLSLAVIQPLTPSFNPYFALQHYYLTGIMVSQTVAKQPYSSV